MAFRKKSYKYAFLRGAKTYYFESYKKKSVHKKNNIHAISRNAHIFFKKI